MLTYQAPRQGRAEGGSLRESTFRFGDLAKSTPLKFSTGFGIPSPGSCSDSIHLTLESNCSNSTHGNSLLGLNLLVEGLCFMQMLGYEGQAEWLTNLVGNLKNTC